MSAIFHIGDFHVEHPIEFIFWDRIPRIIGVAAMSSPEDWKFREIFENWAQSIETHQRCIFKESARFVEELKQRKLSAKTKNEILIVIKGLRATVKSVSKVVGKYIE